jgi:hypothetical protein
MMVLVMIGLLLTRPVANILDIAGSQKHRLPSREEFRLYAARFGSPSRKTC